jgi:putative oxidoreductase
MFCWAFLLLVFTGPGALALDRLLSPRGADRPAEETAKERATTAA